MALSPPPRLRTTPTLRQELAELVAGDLAADRVVVWYQERDEFGPRALGRRVLLANPSRRHNLGWLNRIKGRQPWRPVAPSLLLVAPSRLFTRRLPPELGRYMLVACEVAEEYVLPVPAVVHIDRSTRPHLVRREHDGELYWHLIDAFRQRTGVPLVCNTLFNLAGKPVVHSPGDPVDAFV